MLALTQSDAPHRIVPSTIQRRRRHLVPVVVVVSRRHASRPCQTQPGRRSAVGATSSHLAPLLSSHVTSRHVLHSVRSSRRPRRRHRHRHLGPSPRSPQPLSCDPAPLRGPDETPCRVYGRDRTPTLASPSPRATSDATPTLLLIPTKPTSNRRHLTPPRLTRTRPTRLSSHQPAHTLSISSRTRRPSTAMFPMAPRVPPTRTCPAPSRVPSTSRVHAQSRPRVPR